MLCFSFLEVRSPHRSPAEFQRPSTRGLPLGPTFLSSLVLESLCTPPAVAAAVIVIQPGRPGTLRGQGRGGGTRAVGRSLSLQALCLSSAPLLYL